MLGGQFIGYVNQMQVATSVGVEDFADRFNFIVTVVVLLLCSTIVTAKQYLLKPISCYIANEVGGRNLLDYVENYCWVQGTIPISFSKTVPENEDDWKKLENNKILYYQWVPFVLGLQCVLFYLPRVIWQIICYNQTGTDLCHLVALASEAIRAKADKRLEIVDQLAWSVEQLLFQHRETRKGRIASARRMASRWFCNLCISKRLGSQLFGAYLLIKLLYLANGLGQLYLMQSFIGIKARNSTFDNSTITTTTSNATTFTSTDTYAGPNSVNASAAAFNGDLFFGVTVALDLIRGKDWQETLAFPRVGFCVVPIRQLSGNVFVTAQCALPANMFIELVYLFLWFWILFTTLLTLLSIPMWIVRMAVHRSRTLFVRRFLQLSDQCSYRDHLMVDKFCCQFLRHDGIFILRMIRINAGEIVCGDIVEKLWEIYRLKYFSVDFNVADGESLAVELNELRRGKHLMARLDSVPHLADSIPRATAPSSFSLDHTDDYADEIVQLKKRNL